MTTKPEGRQPVNQKEYLNTHLTRRQVRQELRRYHQGNIEPLQNAVRWLSLPLYRRAWITVRGWWAREFVCPPREPRWWPERVSWSGEAS